MRKLKEVLRLKFDCALSNRAIARAVGVSASSVSYYVRSLLASGIPWADAQHYLDDELEQLLAPHCKQRRKKSVTKTTIDFKYIHQELKRKGVTMQLLWQEYKAQDPNPVSYSTYCQQYRRWRKSLKPSMRQRHRAGEKCFVDYAGPKIPIRDPSTGKHREAVIFIAVLGASNFTYAEATLTRSSADWLGSHVRMFEYFGGVPELVIPDNEKSGVSKACYYDPEINPNYAFLATHYQCAILPTRPYHPQDKAKVEIAVQIVERWILARLRKMIFFSLEELNQAIAALLTELNAKPFQKQCGNRQSAFERLDKPALNPLPQTQFEYAEIKRTKVRLDYHIDVDGHLYSVPSQLINETVEYRRTNHTLEVYYQSGRVASHTVSSKVGEATTCREHMPKAHQKHNDWSPEVFIKWATGISDSVIQVATHIVNEHAHPECCYRIHLGLKKLHKQYGSERFGNACQRALLINAPHFRTIKSILNNKLDTQSIDADINELEQWDSSFTSDEHINVRGPDYYKNQQGENHAH